MSESARNKLIREFAQRVSNDEKDMERLQRQLGEAGTELDTETREYMEAHPGMSYEDACTAVLENNPTLSVRFAEETAEKAAKRF